MTAVIVILVIVAVLTLIGLLRFGAIFQYSADGLVFSCVCGPLKINLIPGSGKPKKEKKQKKSREKKPKQKKTEAAKKPEEEKGGTMDKIKAVLPTALKTAGRFFKHLSIDELTLRFVITGDDPCDIAMNYGYASAAMGFLIPVIKSNFKIKKWDVAVSPSFVDSDETVFIKAKSTIALWEIIYIIAKLDFKAIFSVL